jgi:hypothetical protein
MSSKFELISKLRDDKLKELGIWKLKLYVLVPVEFLN